MCGAEVSAPVWLPNVGRDFCAIEGGFDLRDHKEVKTYIVHLKRGTPYQISVDRPKVGTWSIQVMRPGAPLIGTWAGQPCLGDVSVCLAGSIWSFGRINGGVKSGIDLIAFLRDAALRGELQEEIGKVQGDYVLAAVTRRDVVLFRSFGSTVKLYYRVLAGELRWASNFMTLVNGRSDLDVEALAYLAWGGQVVPYRDVFCLSPGEFVRFDGRDLCIGRLEENTDSKKHEGARMSLDDWATLTRVTLRQTLEQSTKPFNRIGVMLSGGIDSSAIVACLAEFGKDVVCYNWSSPSYPPSDESEYAQAVCKRFGVPLRFIDISQDRLPGSRFLEEWRFVVPYPHNLYRWWREAITCAESEVECLVSGQGADSLFGVGSRGFTPMEAVRGLRISEAISYLVHCLTIPHIRITRSNAGVAARFYAPTAQHAISNWWPMRRHIYHFTESAQTAVKRWWLQPHRSDEIIQNDALYLNDMYPRNIVHIAPYFAHAVQELGRCLPLGYLCVPYGGKLITKPVLRQAFIDVLPANVIRRNWDNSFGGIIEGFCMNNIETLRKILKPDAYLVRLGVIDYKRCMQVLNNTDMLRMHSGSLVTNAMIELWLRSTLS